MYFPTVANERLVANKTATCLAVTYTA